MNKSVIARSLLLAGALAAGAAQAQTYWSATGTSDSPQQAGEASTMTNGVPNMVTTNSPYPDGTPVVVLAPNGTPYYGPQYYYPGQVVTTPGYPVYSAPYGTPVYPAVVATSPSYSAPRYSTYPSYPAVISHAPQNPAVVMPRQIVPSTSGPIVYYTR